MFNNNERNHLLGKYRKSKKKHTHGNVLQELKKIFKRKICVRFFGMKIVLLMPFDHLFELPYYHYIKMEQFPQKDFIVRLLKSRFSQVKLQITKKKKTTECDKRAAASCENLPFNSIHFCTKFLFLFFPAIAHTQFIEHCIKIEKTEENTTQIRFKSFSAEDNRTK